MSYERFCSKLREQPETARAGSPWTPEEDQELLHMLHTEMTLEEIAQQHQRTPKAIQQRLLWMAFRMVKQDNVSVETACEQMCVSKEAFEAYEKRRTTPKPQKSLKPQTLQPPAEELNVVLASIQEQLRFISKQLETLTETVTRKL
jgi:hypothetical protein